MAKQTGKMYVVGTMDNICYYECGGNFYMRSSSSLSGKRVRNSPEFRNTMMYAGLLSKASRIASAVYNSVAADQRKYWMFRALTGSAMQWLKLGKAVEEITALLRISMNDFIAIPKKKRTRSCLSGRIPVGESTNWLSKTSDPNSLSTEYLKVYYDLVFTPHWKDEVLREMEKIKRQMGRMELSEL